MEIEDLNARLMELTPSEIAHRKGTLSSDWNSFWDSNERGLYVNSIARVDGNLLTEARDGSLANGLYSALDGCILVRQNTRFNPVPPHVHSYIEMNYVYAGSCPQRVGDSKITLEEDEILLLDTNCPHSIEALDRGDIMLSFILLDNSILKRDLLGSITQGGVVSQFLIDALNAQTDHDRFLHFRSRGNRRIRLFFQELLCEIFDPSTNADSIVIELLRLIFAELINVYESDYSKREKQERSIPVIPIIRHIEKNYLTCTQDTVAKKFGISPRYVSILLKKHTGMTYRQMIQAQKLGHAAALLRNTPLPISDIAEAAGYENQSFFYRKFREQYGMQPAAYREKHRSRS